MEKHKHYQAIRAFADGWQVEWASKLRFNRWHTTTVPTFDKSLLWRIVPDAEGWLPWYGGDTAPINGPVDVIFRDNIKAEYATSALAWYHLCGNGDIIRYRPHKEEEKPKLSLDSVQKALSDAIERMDRARKILTNGNPQPHCNWGMLDTSDLRSVIKEEEKFCNWDINFPLFKNHNMPTKEEYEYLWVLEDKEGSRYLSTVFYKNIDDARQNYHSYEVIDRCEWSKRRI